MVWNGNTTQLPSKAQDSVQEAVWFTGPVLLRKHNFYLWPVPEPWLLPLVDRCQSSLWQRLEWRWNTQNKKYTYSKKKKESILSKIIPTSPWSKRSRFFFTVSNNLNLKYHLPLAITAKKSSLLPFSVSWLFQWKSGLLLCSGLTSEYFAPLSPWAAEKPASVLIQLLQQDCERFLDRFAGSILL